MTPPQALQSLGRNNLKLRQALYQALRRGQVKGTKVGRNWRVEEAAVQQWLASYVAQGTGTKKWHDVSTVIGSRPVKLYFTSRAQADRLIQLCLDLGYSGKIYKLFSAVLNREVRVDGRLCSQVGTDQERFELLLGQLKLENPSQLARLLADGEIKVRKVRR